MKINLTSRQVEFVEACMLDYVDVTADRHIRRDARAVLRRLERAKKESRKKR